MRSIGLSLLIIITSTACNLTAATPTMTPTHTPSHTATPLPLATITLTGAGSRPTLLPLPGLPVINITVTSVPGLGTVCQVYTTYSGTRTDNTLSLRDAPSVDAIQIFRVPNNVRVLLMPGSQEVATEGYHWLNVIYEDSPRMRYQGWVARDSFEVNGVRNPSIATLRQGNTQHPC